MTYGRTVTTVGLFAAAAALAACSSTAGSAPSESPSVAGSSTTAEATPPPSPASVEPSTPAPSTTSATPTTASVSPTKSARPDGHPFVTTCTKLTTRIIPGGAVRGAEIAAVQYTNDGKASCTISGYPTLVLLKSGKKIGTPSQPSGKTVKQMTLQPGDVAESLVRDFSTCNAPLADQGRVTVPGRTDDDATTTVAPVKLRACILRIDPVGPPA